MIIKLNKDERDVLMDYLRRVVEDKESDEEKEILNEIYDEMLKDKFRERRRKGVNK